MKTQEALPRLPNTWAVRVHQWGPDLTAKTPLDARVNVSTGPAPFFVDMHRAIEVGITLSGNSERVFLGHSEQVGPGEVWLAGSWEPHGALVLDAGERVLVSFLPELLGDEVLDGVPWLRLFSVRPDRRPWVKDGVTRAAVLRIGREIKAEIEGQRPGWEAAVRLDLLRVLLTLRRAWEPPSGPDDYSALNSSLARLAPALELVRDTPSDRVSLREAADACGLSVSQFSRVFQGTMGTSFSRFCFRARIAAAADLLLTTDLPTQAIAEQTGFADASHLNHAFSRQYRMGPAAYRQSLGGLV